MLRTRFFVFLFSLSLLSFPPSLRADNIDTELLKNSKKILEDLRSSGVKNVGVLRFRLEQTDNKSVRASNLLTANLANRLENSLILASDSKSSLGITRGAGYFAAKAAPNGKVTSLESPDGRASLFKVAYPLAWGNNKVTVDAFLTGSVKVSKDLRSTTVTISKFRANDSTAHPILTFTAKTDRSMLVDLGQSFVVRRTANGGSDEDELLNNEATNNANNQSNGGASNNNALSQFLDFKVFFGGQQVDFQGDPNSSGEGVTVREPRKGESVHFLCNRKSEKKLAIVLLINGNNTTVEDEENADIKACTKWVLVNANTEYRIDGFYAKDGKSVKTFQVLSDEESKEATLNPETKGLITLAVFEEGTKDGQGLFTSRSLRTYPKAVAQNGGQAWPSSLADARKQLLLKMSPAKSAGIIVGGTTNNVDLQTSSFENPVLIGSLTLRYYPKD